LHAVLAATGQQGGRGAATRRTESRGPSWNVSSTTSVAGSARGGVRWWRRTIRWIERRGFCWLVSGPCPCKSHGRGEYYRRSTVLSHQLHPFHPRSSFFSASPHQDHPPVHTHSDSSSSSSSSSSSAFCPRCASAQHGGVVPQQRHGATRGRRLGPALFATRHRRRQWRQGLQPQHCGIALCLVHRNIGRFSPATRSQSLPLAVSPLSQSLCSPARWWHAGGKPLHQSRSLCPPPCSVLYSPTLSCL
jgi:hypothetical protein